jgi:AcrR family transcriptional regulator
MNIYLLMGRRRGFPGSRCWRQLETFVEQGYAGATLAQIGARLKVSPAAVLRHEPSKKALFLAAMRQVEADLLPLEFLKELDGSEDPRPILRRVGEVLIPFLEERIRGVVARWIYFKTIPGVGRMPLPFDPKQRPTPPQKNLQFLQSYLGRASRHGRVRVRDARAAALAFLALHSYVFMQQVMEVLESPLPVEDYLDTVIDVWTQESSPIEGQPMKRKGLFLLVLLGLAVLAAGGAMPLAAGPGETAGAVWRDQAGRRGQVLLGGRVAGPGRQGSAVAAGQPIVELETDLIDLQIQQQDSRVAGEAALARSSRAARREIARAPRQNAERNGRLASLKGGIVGQEAYDAAATQATTTAETFEARAGSPPRTSPPPGPRSKRKSGSSDI